MAQLDRTALTGYMVAIGGGLGAASGAMASTEGPLGVTDGAGNPLTPPIVADVSTTGGTQQFFFTTLVEDFYTFSVVEATQLEFPNDQDLRFRAGPDVDSIEFAGVTYGGFLPLDAHITEASVTGLSGGTFSAFSLGDGFSPRFLNNRGFAENVAFTERGLIPFIADGFEGNSFLGYLDLTLEGTTEGVLDENGVELADLLITTVTINGGASAYGGVLSDLKLAGPAVVPGPATLPLLAAGIGGLAALKRRRRRRLDA